MRQQLINELINKFGRAKIKKFIIIGAILITLMGTAILSVGGFVAYQGYQYISKKVSVENTALNTENQNDSSRSPSTVTSENQPLSLEGIWNQFLSSVIPTALLQEKCTTSALNLVNPEKVFKYPLADLWGNLKSSCFNETKSLPSDQISL